MNFIVLAAPVLALILLDRPHRDRKSGTLEQIRRFWLLTLLCSTLGLSSNGAAIASQLYVSPAAPWISMSCALCLLMIVLGLVFRLLPEIRKDGVRLGFAALITVLPLAWAISSQSWQASVIQLCLISVLQPFAAQIMIQIGNDLDQRFPQGTPPAKARTTVLVSIICLGMWHLLRACE